MALIFKLAIFRTDLWRGRGGYSLCAVYTLGVPRVPCAVEKLKESYNGSLAVQFGSAVWQCSLAVHSEDPILFYIPLSLSSQSLSKPYSANGVLATDTKDILR